MVTQRRPLTRMPIDVTEDGRWSSAADAKLPTEFPEAATKTDVNGPDPPFPDGSNAPLQLPRCGHSCNAQHFRTGDDGSADKAA